MNVRFILSTTLAFLLNVAPTTAMKSDRDGLPTIALCEGREHPKPPSIVRPSSPLSQLYTRMADAGWCPSMANPPREALRKSKERVLHHTCIPSSPASCDGSCSMPIQLPKEVQEKKKKIDALREALKIVVRTPEYRSVVEAVGRSAAMKIVEATLSEGSDEDTASTDSSTSMSPHSRDEEMLEDLERIGANSALKKEKK
jgi:hypothetical protein